MVKPKYLTLFCILLVCLCLSCERTQTEIDMSVVSPLKSIPMEYGQLISVTQPADYANWAQLWFQDSLGTIRIVRIQYTANLIHNDVKTITRN